MKKMVFLAWMIVFLPAMAFAQEKVEAPVWNVGDKWSFTGNGSIEVAKADQSGYILKFSEGICIFERQGFNAILFEKVSLNRVYSVEGDKRKKYIMGLSRTLDFPLIAGKQSKSGYSAIAVSQIAGFGRYLDYSEVFKVIGWEDVEVRQGKFKALRLEYRRKIIGATASMGANLGEEIINQYWYSPDAKYFVKCQYDKDWMKSDKEIFNWELTSFQLKK